MKRINQEDLEHILAQTSPLWEQVRNKNIFVTGGTGFFGKWLLESFQFINQKLDLNAQVVVLTRNPEKFFDEYPFYKADRSIQFIQGDLLNFEYPNVTFQFIIHAATEADAALNQSQPLLMLDTITAGTRRVLEFARQQPVESFLFTSSGAIYGRQPANITHVTEKETYSIELNNPNSAYAEGKRLAELYCSIYHTHHGLPVKIARCFAFVGPYLPLDKHFAIGNFISNALKGQNIIIKGDGTPYRSYLYAADLTVWLWTILLKGQDNTPYNVGSDEDYNLGDVARTVSTLRPGIEVQILTAANTSIPPQRYVPNVDLAKDSLGLKVYFNLAQGVANTMKFYESL